jgi:hypothetical protein
MFWSQPGAQTFSPYAESASRRVDQFWKARFDGYAACNDLVPLAA